MVKTIIIRVMTNNFSVGTRTQCCCDGFGRIGFINEIHGFRYCRAIACYAEQLPVFPEELAKLRKADPRKAAVAILWRRRTAVSNGWIAERRAMGHASTVSRIAKEETLHASTLGKLERAVGREAPRERTQKDAGRYSKFKE